MPEMNERIENTHMAKFEAPGFKVWAYTTVWIFGKFRGFVWKMLLESKSLLSNNLFIQIVFFL